MYQRNETAPTSAIAATEVIAGTTAARAITDAITCGRVMPTVGIFEGLIQLLGRTRRWQWVDDEERRLLGGGMNEYRYLDGIGCAVFVHRAAPDGRSEFQVAGSDEWVVDRRTVRPVPYRFPRVIRAVRRRVVVWVAPSERCVHALETLGATATTAAGGYSAWTADHADQLRGGIVVVVAGPGSVAVVDTLSGLARQVTTYDFTRGLRQ